MTCLRLSFENWVDNEPEELETDRPTEQELHEYEEAEKRHAALVSLVYSTFHGCSFWPSTRSIEF